MTVYVSEELDVSDLRESDGGQLEDDPATFRRVNGSGTFTVENPERANFTNVTPGSYDLVDDTDDRPELDVVRPRVTSLVLRSRDGANVTNRTVRADRVRTLTVVAEYDFDEADRLQVTMRHEGGAVALDQRAARITESGGRYTIGMLDRPPGNYTVTVTGSAIEAGTRSATVRLVSPDGTATQSPAGTPNATPTDAPTAAATPTPTADGSPTVTPTTTAAASPTTTAADGSGPGVLGAVLAVALATVALLRRRT